MKRRLAVLTSGGDAPGMNTAIRAVVRTAVYLGYEVLGVRRGFAGLIAGDFAPLTKRAVGDIIHRGGTILHSARSEEFKHPTAQQKAVAQCRARGICALVVIGGDGSMRGAQALEECGLKTIGIPATIDNDIPFTDYSIGFDTCVNTIVDAINRLRDTATSHERIFVVEVMGRKSGFIALEAGVASGAESILLPEIAFDIAAICDKIRRGYRAGKKHHIIVVAEGAGRATEIASQISSALKEETRVSILGHIQRGGTPTARDRLLASMFGHYAVKCVDEGQQGSMVAVRGGQLTLVKYAQVMAGKKTLDTSLHFVAEEILSR